MPPATGPYSGSGWGTSASSGPSDGYGRPWPAAAPYGAPVPGGAVGGYGWPARPLLQLGEIWQWAWSQIKDQPLVLAGLPLLLVPSAILLPSLLSLLEPVEGALTACSSS
ncbi:hypothetical protein J5X07_04425 [Actinomyces bowdenii]|uniref:hypothetical protein n=1 Tax=Actinomyces bowdenii TaxID=131109 RepID=UPI001ABD00A9|nr:hypothetical protein [Actinomyces bowdenii]MBO3724277.1 hypothetical protein [Actinomyces bowdenii]